MEHRPSTGEPVENENNTDPCEGLREVILEEAPGAWGLKGDEGQQEGRQKPLPCEDLVGEKRECGRIQRSKRQGRCLGPDATGHLGSILRTAGGFRRIWSMGLPEAREGAQGHLEKKKKIIMNEKVPRVQIFFKTYLESKFAVMFLN